ncbi:MAG TPA: xanthine dehydrogenase family protein subunit M [Burkholderiales bacterium]|nr:xanthine dehydrogenase family protein subunit M [Burkholderiales bacterium]
MKPPPFTYHDPRTLAEALRLAGSLENAKLLAGGQSLAPMLNFRYVLPDHVIDLNRIDELSGVRIGGRRITVGAMTRQRALEKDAALARLCPVVREALAEVGHFQTRNRGTLGGSLAHLDPAAELPGIMALYDAKLEIRNSSRTRQVSIGEWTRGYMTPDLAPGEIVTSLSWDAWEGRHGHAFVEFARRRGDFAIVGAGALVSLDERNLIEKAAIALVGVAYGPVRLGAAERALAGKRLDEAAIEAAAAEARRIEAKSDLYASGAYRQRLAGVLTARALQTAGERARG